MKFTVKLPRRLYDRIFAEARRRSNPDAESPEQIVNDIILACVTVGLPELREMSLSEFLGQCRSVRRMLEVEAPI